MMGPWGEEGERWAGPGEVDVIGGSADGALGVQDTNA